MKSRISLKGLGALGATAGFLLLLIGQNLSAQIIPASRMTTWQGNVGIPGGVPNRTTIYKTIPAGASLSTIQNALNACPSNQVVYLAAGTYTINGIITIPSYVTLRGAGPGQTILSGTGSTAGSSNGGMIQFGGILWPEWNDGTAYTIASGFIKDSTNVVISSPSGIAVGNLMWLDELNDTSLVNLTGSYGTFGGANLINNTRVLGQTVEVTAVNGTTITFQPAMYYTYSSSLSPRAFKFTVNCQWGGLENLTLYANNSGYTAMWMMCGGKYCWLKNVEDDFCDANRDRRRRSWRPGELFSLRDSGLLFSRRLSPQLWRARLRRDDRQQNLRVPD